MMTLKEAYALLDATKCDPKKPSKVNSQLTEVQAVDIVRAGIATLGQARGERLGLDDPIHPTAERRVLQVTQNRKNPK